MSQIEKGKNILRKGGSQMRSHFRTAVEFLHPKVREGRQAVVRFTAREGNRTYLLLRAAIEKFLADRANVRANAIAYSIVIALIPLFTVLINFSGVAPADIRTNVAGFLAAYGLTDSGELLGILDEILERADYIANIGIALMLYSATSLLLHLEDSFNHIYRARRDRPYVFRFSMYIASLVVLPTLLLILAGGVNFFLNQIRPPELRDITSVEGRQLITANNGVLRYLKDDGEFEQINLTRLVDRTAAYRDLYYDPEREEWGPVHAIMGGEQSFGRA